MAQALDVSITDLSGVTKAYLHQYSGLEVVVPLNDSRTARVTIPRNAKAATEVSALNRLLKIRYFGIPVFWGLISRPRRSGQTIEIGATDLSLKLQKTFLRNGDYAVDTGYDFGGGIGMFQLLEAARLAGTNWATWTPAIPDLGIAEGYTDPAIPINPVTVKKAERGAKVWEEIQEYSSKTVGPDFEIQPFDERYNPNGSAFHDPTTSWRNVCEFNVYKRQGSDTKWETIRFHDNFGRSNATIDWEDGGDEMVNYAVAVGGDDNKTRKFGRVVPSFEKYGIYGDWISGATGDTTGVNVSEVLTQAAKGTVLAYGLPPAFLTVNPVTHPPDKKYAYRYMRDFIVGDTILAASKYQPEGVKSSIARITKVTLTQNEQTGLVDQALECVPRSVAAADVSSGDA